MKSFIQVSLILLGLSAALFACGAQTGTTPNNGVSCGAGSTYIGAYGCISQGPCQPGYGYYNGQCMAGTTQQTGGTIGQTTYSCSGGQISTIYGCLSQGNCPAGSALYYNQCVPGNSGTNTSASCQGRCMPGQVNTQYGCVQQGNCGSCMGSFYGSCIQGYPAY